MVKLDVLRAEKSKSNENINWITTKSVELDSRLNQLRTEIRETKNKVQDTKTDCLKRGRKILAEYYKIINGEKIIDSISKMTPTIKPVLPEIKVQFVKTAIRRMPREYDCIFKWVKCSSKTKKMLEENSVILQAQNISRFLNYTSGIFLYPLRFSANFGNIETHNGEFKLEISSFRLFISKIQILVAKMKQNMNLLHILIVMHIFLFNQIYFISKEVVMLKRYHISWLLISPYVMWP